MGSVEIYCRLRFRSLLYSVAVLNLNRSLVFSSSLSFMFFWWPKERKAPALAKSVTTAFCSRVASDIPRLVVVCHKLLSVQASGTKQLTFHAITATYIYTAQTNFVLFPLLERLFTVILMVPVFLWYCLCSHKVCEIFYGKGNYPPMAERHRWKLRVSECVVTCLHT